MMNDDNNDEDAGDHDHVDDVDENYPKQTWHVRPQAVRTHSLMYLIRPSQHCEQFGQCHVKISNCGMMTRVTVMLMLLKFTLREG